MKWKIFFALLFLNLLIFAPALDIPFVQHDQFRYFINKLYHPRDPQFGWLIAVIGRPVAGIIEQGVFYCTSTLLHLHLFRLLAVLGVTLIGTLFVKWLERFHLPLLDRIAIAAALFCLPAIQNFVIMANLPNILVILSAFVAYTAWNARQLRKSAFFLLVALFGYPALAMFFFVPFAFELLSSHESPQEIWQRAKRAFLFFSGAALFYLIAVKLFLQKLTYMPSKEVIPSGYRFEFGWPDWGFMQDVLYAMGNLWNIYPFTFVALGVLGASAYFAWKRGRSVLLGCALVLFLIQAPMLFLKSPMFLYRIFFCVSGLLAGILLLSLRGPFRFGLAAAAMLLSHWNVTETALAGHMEYNHIRNAIEKAPLQSLTRIHYVLPRYTNRGINRLAIRTDEFNVPNTAHTGELSMISDCILRQTGCGKFSSGSTRHAGIDPLLPLRNEPFVDITYAFSDENADPPEQALVIDMTILMPKIEEGRPFE